MVLEPVLEGVSSPVRSRNGPSLAFPPPSGPPRAPRPGLSFEGGRPTGSHSGCRKADRGTTTAGEGRRTAVPDQGFGHVGRREADPSWRDGPTGAHSGGRKADRGYMTNSDEAGRRETVPARDEDGGEGPAHRHQLTSSGLWTGRLDPVEAPHAATGIIRGFLPSHARRGMCEVRGDGPNLWPLLVLHGLGFEVGVLRFRDRPFLEALRVAGFGSRALPYGANWWRKGLARVGGKAVAVFLDHEGVRGDAARSLTMSHDELGGSTTASWSLVAWYPPGHDSPPPIQCPPQPHAPLSTRLGDGEWAEPCPPPLPPASYPRGVVYSEDGGAVLGCGLFPHDRLDQPVECACRFSPTGFGRRAVTPLEIAALWDVSILVTDRISAMTTFRGLIRALGATPPAKFLQFGADRLITGGFRGGSSEGLVVDRPSIAVDSEECEVKESGDDEEPPLAAPGVRSPSPSAMDRAPAPTWNDQDAQKVDNSPVPTHLWEFFFERVYLEECGELPAGWRQALDGFRRFQLRWWRRRKLAGTFREWRLEHYPLQRLTRLDTAYVERSPGGDEVRYRWRMSPDSRLNLGRELYTRHWAQLNEMPKFETSRLMAADAIAKAAGPYHCHHPRYIDTFWTWPIGSTLFYWRWPERYQADARDGQPHFLLGDFGGYVRPQAAPKPEDREKVLLKLLPVRQRGYIEAGSGKVRSLINYFWVDKGETDIRIVYDGTGCGLNDFIWAMHFGLPTMRHTLRSLLPGYYQCDGDIGEMFLNFMLHEILRELSGVDISHVKSGDPVFEAARAAAWERWCRNWMGLKDSPVRSIQLMTRVKLVAYGDRRVRTNPFHWERVVFNLPGTSGYRPDLPWVMKVRFDGHLACEVFVYVDDSRATGHSRWISWRAFRHFAAVCTRHGIQIAERKSNFPSQVPQSWAGTNTDTSGGQVSATVSEKKWQKTKDCVRQLAELVSAADAAASPGSSEAVRIPLKPLLSIMGFLIYVVRTYDWMTPYLKGLNNVINGWRPGYEDGWKLTGRAAREHERAQEEAERDLTSGSHTMMFRRAHEENLDEVVPVAVGPEAPSTVKVFDRLRRDIKALLELTSSEDPPRRRIRSKEVLVALYLPGDASGKGFGSALIRREGVEYEAGVW
ncbi:hypothetical protein THAOC_17263, partial [Thalassiosira oceanica]